MPFTIDIDHIPAGISLTAALPEEDVLVCTKAYLSSEDGNNFVSHLEGIWGYFSGPMRQRGVWPSQVDHLLALCDKDKKMHVYCNELQQRVRMRSKRAIQAGEQVAKDDIASIEEFFFIDSDGNDIEIASDKGIVLILSVGWRKCLYYDLDVLGADSQPRSLDVAKLFARFYQHLLFQEMYSITDEQWARMVQWGWFPFVWMNSDERNKVIQFSIREAEPRQLFEEICRRYQSILSHRKNSWQRVELLKEHGTFIDKAAEHFLANDYISAIQVLYPRIEGVLRKLHLLRQPGERPGQGSMVENLIADHSDYSLLLPQRFREYLLGFYFRAFDQEAGDVPLSRHTIAHGASLPEDYDYVQASLGFMILDQIFYYLVGQSESK